MSDYFIFYNYVLLIVHSYDGRNLFEAFILSCKFVNSTNVNIRVDIYETNGFIFIIPDTLLLLGEPLLGRTPSIILQFKIINISIDIKVFAFFYDLLKKFQTFS